MISLPKVVLLAAPDPFAIKRDWIHARLRAINTTTRIAIHRRPVPGPQLVRSFSG